MTVHTVQLRVVLAALEVMERTTADPPSEVTQTVVAAAKELLTLREAGALIITPDENGDFPAWAVEEALMWKMGQRPDGLFNALRDAMPPEDAK